MVPATVPRYALNAANARWGSLFDAFYGTDALPQDHDLAPGYDEQRGAQVIAAADELLDELFPLAEGSHADVTAYRVTTGGGRWSARPALADPGQFAGLGRTARDPAAPPRPARRADDQPGDPGRRASTTRASPTCVLESAVTTIVDLEDSVATVDGEDKAAGLPHLARPHDRRR